MNTENKLDRTTSTVLFESKMNIKATQWNFSRVSSARLQTENNIPEIKCETHFRYPFAELARSKKGGVLR